MPVDPFKFSGCYPREKITNNGRYDVVSADYPLIGPFDAGDLKIVRGRQKKGGTTFRAHTSYDLLEKAIRAWN